MALGGPASEVLIQIAEASDDAVNRRTLTFLRERGFAVPRAGQDESRIASDWELTDEGRRAARDLAEHGSAYLPGEFAAERAKFEDTLEALRDSQAAVAAPAGDPPSELSVVTWNLRFSSDADSTLAFLDATEWDLACLQEVGVIASNRLAEREGWSVVNGLQLAWNDGVSGWRTPHGAAIVARNGWQLEAGAVVSDTPTPGRGVTALARRGGESVRVMSWHAPNRAGEGLETKMAGYRAMIDAVRQVEGPLIVGMDANHGSLGTSLDPGDPQPDHEHALEIEFFSNRPGHGLSDAFLSHLRSNPDAYNEILRTRPDGPLAVTYTHGGTADRYDYIMVSGEFAVVDVTHDYEGALGAGSDHGLVRVQLTSDTARRT